MSLSNHCSCKTHREPSRLLAWPALTPAPRPQLEQSRPFWRGWRPQRPGRGRNGSQRPEPRCELGRAMGALAQLSCHAPRSAGPRLPTPRRRACACALRLGRGRGRPTALAEAGSLAGPSGWMPRRDSTVAPPAPESHPRTPCQHVEARAPPRPEKSRSHRSSRPPRHWRSPLRQHVYARTIARAGVAETASPCRVLTTACDGVAQAAAPMRPPPHGAPGVAAAVNAPNIGTPQCAVEDGPGRSTRRSVALPEGADARARARAGGTATAVARSRQPRRAGCGRRVRRGRGWYGKARPALPASRAG